MGRWGFIQEYLTQQRLLQRLGHFSFQLQPALITYRVLYLSWLLYPKEHIKAIHEKLMKHQCVHCGKVFSHFSNLNRHIRLIHEKLVIATNYVNCPQCQNIVQATSLKKHIKSIHEKARDHVCEFCCKRFSQSYTLKVSKFLQKSFWGSSNVLKTKEKQLDNLLKLIINAVN